MDAEDVAGLLLDGVRPAFSEVAAAVEILMASRPQQHPLGFVFWHRPLEQGRSLRVHLWFDAEFKRDDGLTHIHDHTYDLASLVVYGAVENSLYTVDESSDGLPLVAIDPESLVVEPLASHVAVSAAAGPTTHRAGELYRVPKGSFHTSRLVESPSLTLVANGVASGSPRVVANGEDEPRGAHRPAIEEGVWTHYLREISAALGRDSGWHA